MEVNFFQISLIWSHILYLTCLIVVLNVVVKTEETEYIRDRMLKG